MRQCVAQGIGIGEVATAFAGDAKLASGLVHLLEQQHPPTTFGRCTGGHQSRSTTANNNYIVIHLPSDLCCHIDIVLGVDAKDRNLRLVDDLLGGDPELTAYLDQYRIILTPAEQQERMKEWVSQYDTDYTAVYCNMSTMHQLLKAAEEKGVSLVDRNFYLEE